MRSSSSSSRNAKAEAEPDSDSSNDCYNSIRYIDCCGGPPSMSEVSLDTKDEPDKQQRTEFLEEAKDELGKDEMEKMADDFVRRITELEEVSARERLQTHCEPSA